MIKRISTIFLTVLILFSLCNCDNASKSGSSSKKISSTPLSPGKFTNTLFSNSSLTAWTAPVTYVMSESDTAPDSTAEELKICAAKNEFEPFQIAFSGNGEYSVTFDGFKDIGDGSYSTIYIAEYNNSLATDLTEIQNGSSIKLTASAPTVIWVDTFISSEAQSGSYTGTVTVTSSGMNVQIPVSLSVFNFTLPEKIHYNTQINASMSSLKQSGDTGDVEQLKTMLYEHRLITKGGPTWPTGFKYTITYPDNVFYDESDQGIWGIEYNASKYLAGDGWSKPGFPLTMGFQFVDNSTPRPDTFNGLSRGSDHYGTSSYNTLWKQYLSDLNSYLVSNSYAGKVYYYVINEPQNQDDYDLAAYLCKMTKEAAPELLIAVSEEPKAEIAEHNTYKTSDGSSYDIWIADVQHYKQDYAWKRQQNYGESVWFYHNDGTPDPYINPINFEKQGNHQRLIPWISWHYRVSGWAYYNGSIFFSNKIPNVRGKLLREGIEDYEYLYLANGSKLPDVTISYDIDKSVDSAAGSLTAYSNDHDAILDLRWKIGQFIEGSLNEVPVIDTEVVREKGSYYINFQDVEGKPSDDPLVVDGNEFIKIGWSEYDETLGYGWHGGCIGTSRAKYSYDNISGFTEIQKSCLYDDYGKVNLFDFDLEAGSYSVTVGIGRAGKGCYDKHNVTVEGTEFFKAFESSDIVELTKTIELVDGKLSVEIGDAVGQYTFLSYLKIEPVE